MRLERPIVAPGAERIAARTTTTPAQAATVTASIPAPVTPDFIASPLVTTPAVAAATAPQVITSPVSQLRQTPATDSRGLAHAGAAVPLPRERLTSSNDRRTLINRMVGAEPDRANPFRTRKARLHRAKLVEQSIGRKFPGGKSRIDLSQYPMNWPELASDHPAAA